MELDKLDNIEIYQKANDIEWKGNDSVNKALKGNREKERPIIFSKKVSNFYF